MLRISKYRARTRKKEKKNVTKKILVVVNNRNAV